MLGGLGDDPPSVVSLNCSSSRSRGAVKTKSGSRVLTRVKEAVCCAVDVTGDEVLVVIALFKTDADAEEVVDAVLVLDVKGGETVSECVDAEVTDVVDVIGGGFVVVGG